MLWWLGFEVYCMLLVVVLVCSYFCWYGGCLCVDVF